MSRLVEFDLGSGKKVLIEVDDKATTTVRIGDPSRGGVTRKGAVEYTRQKFDEALEQVRPAAEIVFSKLSGLARIPDEITVEFGIKISAEASAIIAKAVSESNFQIKLTWKPARPDPVHS